MPLAVVVLPGRLCGDLFVNTDNGLNIHIGKFTDIGLGKSGASALSTTLVRLVFCDVSLSFFDHGFQLLAFPLVSRTPYFFVFVKIPPCIEIKSIPVSQVF